MMSLSWLILAGYCGAAFGFVVGAIWGGINHDCYDETVTEKRDGKEIE
jgi:hypothetical protein